MAEAVIQTTARGLGFPGTRTTVYDVIPYLLREDYTEAQVARLFDLTPEQVAGCRAYIFAHADTVLYEHVKIEERLRAGNPPEVVERAKGAAERLEKYKRWYAEYLAEEAAWGPTAGPVDTEHGPPAGVTFADWVKARMAAEKVGPAGGTAPEAR